MSGQWSTIFLGTSENLLSDCMEQHLIQLIKNIDKRIYDLVNKTLDILIKQNCENPMDEIRETLSKANAERARINEEYKKRKLENSESKQQPPNKKMTKRKRSNELKHLLIWFLQVYKIPSYHIIFNQYLIFKKFPTNSIVQPLCLGLTNSSYRLDE